MPRRPLIAAGCAALGALTLMLTGCGGGAVSTRTAVLSGTDAVATDAAAGGTQTGTGTETQTGTETSPTSGSTAVARRDVVYQTTRFTPIPASVSRTVRVPILMYHRVADPGPMRTQGERTLNVPPREFVRQMDWLRSHGFTTITQSQLASALGDGAALPAKPVLLTFDDGYIDISKTVLPILRARGMVGTAYVITSRVTGPDRAFMKFKALRKIEAGGIEVGSHTVNHVDLTSLSSSALREELAGSRRVLEKGLGHPVQWLCYPAGRYDATVEAMARETGYVLATTTEPGVTHSASRPYALSRVRISDTTGIGGLASALAG